MTAPVTALVLAGIRSAGDPVADHEGVDSKAFVNIEGKAMIDHVLYTLDQCEQINHILISFPDSLDYKTHAPLMARLIASGKASLTTPAASPARSVLQMVEQAEKDKPLLLTTADHPLLTTAMVEDMLNGAAQDLSVGFAHLETVQRAHPKSQRTKLKFRDGSYSGCNLFVFKTEQAKHAIQFWTQLEEHRKRPLKMLSMIGLGLIVKYALGLLKLNDVLKAIGKKTGTSINAVFLDHPEAAIDVDKPEDLELVREIMKDKAA